MAVIKKLTRLGGSQAVVLPRVFLEQMNLAENDDVELTLTADGVLVSPHRYLDADTAQTIGRRIATKRASALKRLAK